MAKETSKALTQGRIIKALAAGAVIRVEHTSYPPSSARRVYRIVPGNELVQEKTVKRLEHDRLIRPAGDGLFADGPAQSYVLFRASEGGA